MNRKFIIGIGVSLTAVIVAFALGLMIGSNSRTAVTNSQAPIEIKTESPIPLGAIKYNCELSAGTFKDSRCECELEAEQTQEEMYDEQTGFCQSSHGGPAGNAFFTSSGLPSGYYSFWTGIILDLCLKSGGNISGVACICPSGKTYDQTTGVCK